MALKLPFRGDWLLSARILDAAIETILSQVRVDRTREVPDVAGYNFSGKVFYIDKRMPKGFKYNGKIILTDKFLILHEIIEKLLLSNFNIPYQGAHQIALSLERSYVIACRIDWNIYNKFMAAWIKYIGNAKVETPPKDLDLEPYYDEHDTKTIKKIESALKPAGQGIQQYGNIGQS